MYRLLLLLRRIYVPLLFLILEGGALYFYASSTTLSRARLLSVADNALRGVYGAIASAERFVSLATVNRQLQERIAELENTLAALRAESEGARVDSLRARPRFAHEYVLARVVRNSVSKRQNYLMVDRGAVDGVERAMAVLSLDGCVVGYVESTSARNAICVSALNTTFRTSGMVRGSNHFGSVSWPGEDLRTVRLTEVPKYASVARGDSVVTSGSLYFPEGMLIGTVESFTIDEARASYDIDVHLATDIASLRVVMLVKNPEAYERLKLEEEVLGTIREE